METKIKKVNQEKQKKWEKQGKYVNKFNKVLKI